MMKRQAAIALLVLLAGVVTSVVGRNEWQREIVEKEIDPSSRDEFVVNLHANNMEPLGDFGVEETMKEVALSDEDEDEKSSEDDITFVAAAMSRNLNPMQEDSMNRGEDGDLGNEVSTPQLADTPSESEKGRKASKKEKSEKSSKKDDNDGDDSDSNGDGGDDEEEEPKSPKKSPKKEKKAKNEKKKSKKEENDEDDEVDKDKSRWTEIHVVTHAVNDAVDPNNVNSFWNTWLEGAKLAVAGRPDTDLKWRSVGYNATAATEALSDACSSGDAVVVTVPYASTTDEYNEMDEAINKCIEAGVPVFTANTDTYHNDGVYAFFGSSNYDMGVKCGLAVLFPDDVDVIQGRKEAPLLPEIQKNITIYWDAVSRKDEGLKQRLEGLQSTFRKHHTEVTVFLPSGSTKCPCATEYPEGVFENFGEGLRISIPTLLPPDNVFNYPPRYGMDVCGQHDRNLVPTCNSDNPPDFCYANWCYVDPNDCVDTEYTYVGGYSWADFPGHELPYSYGSCGEINQYLDFFFDTEDDSTVAVGLAGEGTQMIVLSSDWAPKFDPSSKDIFICGEETTALKGIPQLGQSPFLQGLSSVSAATAAATALKNKTPWNAYKGNAASSSSSTVFHSGTQITDPKIVQPLSKYGKAIVKKLDEYGVLRGPTWDIWHDAVFEDRWILQHPPLEYLGKSSKDLPVAGCCLAGDAEASDTCDRGNDMVCDTDFGLYRCESDDDCKPKKFCATTDGSGPVFPREKDGEEQCSREEEYFAGGMCKEVSSTVSRVGDSKKKLCVGHSYDLYERMYELIIQADHLVEITSLDSFDLIGTTGSESGSPFLSAIRNALTYLASTKKKIIVKCHFGSAPSADILEDTQRIVESITRDFVKISGVRMDVYVGTYRIALSSWNHGKIIVVDGKKLITGGSNYYQTDYLREDPIHDLSLQVSGGPAITAHSYAKKLWSTACDSWEILEKLMQIAVSHRRPNGSIHTDIFSMNSCPHDFVSMVEDDILDDPPAMNDRPKTGASVVMTARLAKLGPHINGGSHTSDIAMLAMMEAAEKTIKFSQQDMLPLILSRPIGLGVNGLHASGFSYDGQITGTGFDDTWRIIGGIARALTRKVDVYMMVSAPCAFAANDPVAFQAPIAAGVRAQFLCPENGETGPGFDYWERAYAAQLNEGYSKWPEARDQDEKWGHIKDGKPLRMLIRKDVDHEEEDSVHRRLVYGYGWSLGNIAEWIFAYYMIVAKARPKNDDNSPMTADEIVNLICTHAHIGHIRLTAEEETYKRGNYAGGQVGNHAKIVMVDDSAFYIGSDNAYGSGLAEFGLVVDDQSLAQKLEQEYWDPLWTQTLGSKEAPGLVTGSDSVEKKCRWREDLGAGRVAPWNDVTHAMCRTFSNAKDCSKDMGCTWVDKTIPHMQCTIGPHEKRCYMETDYCTGNLLQNGEYCWEDAVCETQYCTWDFECKDKLAQGEGCVEHDDCANGYCSWAFKCDGAALEDGQFCISDDSCKSKRCSMAYECAPKLEDNEVCLLDDDCKTPICNNLFECGYQEDHEVCVFSADCRNGKCNNVFRCGKLPNTWTCAWDSDCESDRCDWDFNCKDKLQDGQTCAISNNCKSGLCNNVFTCGRRNFGQSCLTDNDCKNDQCNWGFKCGKLSNGQICAADSDCESDRCTWEWKCRAKLNKDDRCWNNGDCKSNNCKSFWTGWYCT